MNKITSIVLQIAIAIILLIFLNDYFNGTVFLFWLFIFWVTSTKIDKPTQSPIAWLFCGIATTIICGIDVHTWWQNLQNPHWMDFEPKIRKEIMESNLREFRTSLIQCIVGGLIILGSAWKIVKKHPTQRMNLTRQVA